MWRVKFSRLALLPACLVLASCSLLGPRPNGEILTLAQQAEADAAALGGAPAAGLRAEQAEQLYGEITRLCGTDEVGAPPQSCAVERGAGEAAGVANVAALAHAAPAAGAQAAGAVPAESVDLVVAQAIDITATEPVDLLAPEVTDKADLAAARDMLAHEYALDYALGVALAFSDDATGARIDELRAAAGQRRFALVRLLHPTGEVPAAAPGYELPAGEQPTDAASAAALVDSLDSALVSHWRETAAAATSAPWREAAIAFAAHAQRV
ncbi:protein of unknown function [Corynebacterium timonense]|uniref:DUF4439 domain-containing protein n=1 Tax=Corynebacterium timonense TaxID=441500 RepID=A0A1H1N5J8_9CORY|nr:protein of unknown function [Corynebacterium timonense]